MRQGIDGVGAMVDQHRGDEESPHQHLPPGGAEARRDMLQEDTEKEHADSEQRRHHDVESIQEAQLGIFEQILHAGQVRGEVLMRHEPAHVAPKEAVLHRGMHVIRLVRVHVVVAVMGGPPNGSALYG